MQERLLKVTSDVKQRWDGLDRQQKLRLSLGSLVLLITIVLTIYIIVKPKMDVIVSNSDLTTIGKIESTLESAGINSKIIDNGRAIQVKKGDSIKARMAIESDPNLSSSDLFSYENYFKDGAGIGVSESVKKEMSRLAEANLIASMLMKMDGVREAQVILNKDESNGFLFNDRDVASATVFINTDKDIDKAQALLMAETVANAVNGLTKENVTITNQMMETVYSGSGSDNIVNGEYDKELAKKNELKLSVLSQLSPLYDQVTVDSNLVFNWDKRVSEEMEYKSSDEDALSGIPSRRTALREDATGTPLSGVPGLEGNDNVADDYLTGDGGSTSASRSQVDEDYLIGHVYTQTEESVGDLIYDDSSLSIIVYNYNTVTEAYYNAQQANIQDDLRVDWDTYKMNQRPEPMAAEELTPLINNLRLGTGFPAENISIIGYEMFYFEDAVTTPIDWQQIIIFVILAALIAMLAFGLIRRTKPDEVLDIVPELSVEDLLVSTQLEEEKESEVERLQDIDYTVESEVKKQIDKFVDEKPEAVAQLLRNWLNEGWE